MKKYLHITLILILVLVFVFNSFLNASAIAIVDDSILFGIVGTVLIGCGIVGFSDVDSLSTTVKSFWSSIPDDVKSYFNGLVDLATGHGLGSFTFELTTEVVNAIQNWLSGVISADGGSVSVPSNISLLDSSIFSNVPVVSKESFSSCNTHGDTSVLNIADGQSVQVLWQANFADGSTSKIVNFSRVGDDFLRDDKYLHAIQIVQSGDLLYLNFYTSNSASQHAAWALSNGNMGINSSLSVVGVSTIPFDNTWSPDSVDDEKKLVAGVPLTMPQGLVNSDGVIDSDVLGGMTTEGVRTGSTTTDTPTEQTWLESILSALDGLLDGVLEGIKSLFIPEGFSWDFFLDDLGSVVSPPQAIDLKSYVQNIEIPDVTVNMKGHELTIVDNSMLRDNIATFRKFIGAFMAILVMIFNYNMFMKLMGYGGFTVTDSGRAGNTLTPSTPVNSNLLTYPISRG